MIVILLIVAAAGCLVAGLVLDDALVQYAALGASMLAVLTITLTVWWEHRKEATDTADDDTETSPTEATADTTEAEEPTDTPSDEHDLAIVADTDATVCVVPGRRRYHQPDCQMIGDAGTEEITVDEASAEGFSACTACTPAPAATGRT